MSFLAVCLSFFKRFLTLRIILRKKIVADLIVWCVVFVIEEEEELYFCDTKKSQTSFI